MHLQPSLPTADPAASCARPRTARARRAGGFSMLEVLISMSLLAVGMAAISTTYSMLSDAAVHERRVTHALHVAELTVEDLLLRYAGDPELAQGGHAGAVAYTQDGAPGGSYFTTAWEVATGTPIASARQIRVTVTWTERTGVKTLSLVTVRT
ncbi:MAG: type II secretion system protein [Deltaproteobacteria bacterium]|nr:type II secretion system protein [Deltaproteobacteria bacterium]